jgi:hypothetical protein
MRSARAESPGADSALARVLAPVRAGSGGKMLKIFHRQKSTAGAVMRRSQTVAFDPRPCAADARAEFVQRVETVVPSALPHLRKKLRAYFI